MTRFFGLVLSGLLALTLVGCGGSSNDASQADSIIDRVQNATDRAQTWLDENRQVARDVEQMWREYQAGDNTRAAALLDSLRARVEWDKGLIANEALRNQLLEGGTQVYEQLGRPEDARAMLQEALPHLDGEARQRWEEALRKLDEGQPQEPVPAE